MTHRETKKAKKTNAEYTEHVKPLRIENEDIEKKKPQSSIEG
jgi:hypothetical protein